MSHLQRENDEAAAADLGRFVEMSPTETTQVKQAKDIIEQLNQASQS